MTASIPDLQVWLLEALLGASAADEIEAQQLLRLPESFPFTVSVGVTDLRRHEGFDIHRQGLDMDMVALRRIKTEPPPKPAKKPKKETKAAPVQPSLFDKRTEDDVSDNGQRDAVPVVPVPTPTAGGHQDGMDEHHRIEESIKNEVLRTLSDRAARFLEVRGMFLVPAGPFAAPSVECAEQFRDGHYFGCIALTQAVLEAVIRHVWSDQAQEEAEPGGEFREEPRSLAQEDVHQRRVENQSRRDVGRSAFVPPPASLSGVRPAET